MNNLLNFVKTMMMLSITLFFGILSLILLKNEGIEINHRGHLNIDHKVWSFEHDGEEWGWYGATIK